MNNQERLIDAKVTILQLAQEIGNISKACKKAGIARSSFYEIKKAYEQFGREGLAPQNRPSPQMPNSTTLDQEEKILDMTRQFPAYSYNRISQELQLLGHSIGAGSVRSVCLGGHPKAANLTQVK